MNPLAGTLETVPDQGNKWQELLVLEQLNPNSDSKFAYTQNRSSRSSATHVPYVVQKDIYANNTQKVKERFTDFFASTVVGDKTLATRADLAWLQGHSKQLNFFGEGSSTLGEK